MKKYDDGTYENSDGLVVDFVDIGRFLDEWHSEDQCFQIIVEYVLDRFTTHFLDLIKGYDTETDTNGDISEYQLQEILQECVGYCDMDFKHEFGTDEFPLVCFFEEYGLLEYCKKDWQLFSNMTLHFAAEVASRHGKAIKEQGDFGILACKPVADAFAKAFNLATVNEWTEGCW